MHLASHEEPLGNHEQSADMADWVPIQAYLTPAGALMFQSHTPVATQELSMLMLPYFSDNAQPTLDTINTVGKQTFE